MGQKRVDKVGCGTDIQREIRIFVCDLQLLLRGMEGQRAQIIGRRAIGADDDVGHGRIVSEDTVIL